MKVQNKNLIFIIIIFIVILLIFSINFIILHNEKLKESKYEIYHEVYRDLIFAKIKLSKKYKFERLTMGTSTAHALFNHRQCKMAKIIVFGMTYREFYEYLKAFYINTAIATSAFMLPEAMTSENSISLSFGVSKPISVTAIAAITTRAISIGRKFSTMYRSKPGMPILVDGNGL